MPVAAELPRRDLSGIRVRTQLNGLLILSLGWIALVLAVYYRQLWWSLAAGPSAWTLPELGQGLRHSGFPFAREAATQAVSAIGSAAIMLIAFSGTGRALERWLTPPALTPAERAVVRFANGAGVWSLVFFALAGLGLYRPGVVRVSLIVAAAVALVLAIVQTWRSSTGLRTGVRRGTERGQSRDGVGTEEDQTRDGAGTGPRQTRDGAGTVPRQRRVGARSEQRWQPGRGIWAWQPITVAACVIAFVSALAPEVEHDALWYHLELPRRWLAAGRPVDDITEYISLYPLTWQLLYGGALALDGPPAAKLLHWTTLLAGAAVAASIGRRALGVKSPWLVAALFVTAPTVLWEATTAYVDLAVALHAGIGIASLWMGTRDSDRRWTWLAGIHLGLACGTKHLALVSAAIVLLLVAISRRHWTRGSPSARNLVVVGLLTLTLAAPWYLRSWTASRNPFFPELYSVFGAEPPERWDHLTERGLARFKAHFGRERTPTHLATLPWDVTMHGARYGGTLGPQLLMIAPGVLIVLRRHAAARWLFAGLVLYAAVWASPVSSFQLRFLVPWWLLAAPLVAMGAERVLELAGRAGRGARTIVATTLAIVLILNLPPFTPWHEGDRVGWTGWLTHVVRRVPIEVVTGGISADRWLKQEIRTFGAWAYLNTHAPREARVLTFFGGDHLYAERARLWSEAVVARPVTWGATTDAAETVLTRLDRLGITYLMAPPVHQQTPEQAALTILQPATLAAAFDVVYRDYWVNVYRVRAAPTSERRTIDQRNGR
jgi:hypothetical protein